MTISITKHKHGYFLDSFGSPPGYDMFLNEIVIIAIITAPICLIPGNRFRIMLQPVGNTECFSVLLYMAKVLSYSRAITLYGHSLVNNDAMVCCFVKKNTPFCVSFGYFLRCTMCNLMMKYPTTMIANAIITNIVSHNKKQILNE